VLPDTVKLFVIVALLTVKLALTAEILADAILRLELNVVVVPWKVLFPVYVPFLDNVSDIALEYAVPDIVPAYVTALE